MSRRFILGVGIFALVAAAIGWRISQAATPEPVPFEGATRPPSPAPPCPWRDPEGDLHRFFPGATGYISETRILSGSRVELARRLGRTPTGEENSLRIYRVSHDQTPVGVILTSRVKGVFGGIELVLAVGADERVRGLRLQRQREPATIDAALQSPEWLRAFEGKHAGESWKLGADIPGTCPDAHDSAEAIVAGVRDLLVLLTTAPAQAIHSHDSVEVSLH